MGINKTCMLLSVFKLSLIFVCGAYSARIQLYLNEDYTDLYHDINTTGSCYNLQGKLFNVRSIITDTCFIGYNYYDCAAWSTSKFIPGKVLTSHSSIGYAAQFASLRTCNDHTGGPKLNVDITTQIQIVLPIVIPEVLESYSDVCSCVNLSKFVHFMGNWSIDNHGNKLLAYFEPNCQEQFSRALLIEAGHWTKSRDMHKHTRHYGENRLKIHSFGPDPTAEYFRNNCKNNSSSNSLVWQGSMTRTIASNICESNNKTESAFAGLLFMRVVNELEQISRKVDELKQINQQTGFNFENVKSFFEGKMQVQKDEFQTLSNKIKSDLNDLFA